MPPSGNTTSKIEKRRIPMSEMLSGSEKAAMVLGNTGGAAVKIAFKIDTVKFSWIDAYLQDRAIRNKIQAMRDDIQKTMKSPIDIEELRIMFNAALQQIEDDRISWFVENLKAVQGRTGSIVNSYTLTGRNYIPPVSLSKRDLDVIFAQLDGGVKQADIDNKVAGLREEIKRLEDVLSKDFSPRGRWIYRDDGNPHPYPQGCRWTQYVLAWEKVVSRFEGEVGVEGEAIKTDAERMAYQALGLDRITRMPPFRKPS